MLRLLQTSTVLMFFQAQNGVIHWLCSCTVAYALTTLLLLQVIQLQGDQRKNVLQFLTQEGLVKKDLIKIHGF
jgi:hypothetical protein